MKEVPLVLEWEIVRLLEFNELILYLRCTKQLWDDSASKMITRYIRCHRQTNYQEQLIWCAGCRHVRGSRYRFLFTDPFMQTKEELISLDKSWIWPFVSALFSETLTLQVSSFSNPLKGTIENLFLCFRGWNREARRQDTVTAFYFFGSSFFEITVRNQETLSIAPPDHKGALQRIIESEDLFSNLVLEYMSMSIRPNQQTINHDFPHSTATLVKVEQVPFSVLFNVTTRRGTVRLSRSFDSFKKTVEIPKNGKIITLLKNLERENRKETRHSARSLPRKRKRMNKQFTE